MKIKGKLDGIPLELEVYKIQISLFGHCSALIYNEDKSQLWEEHDEKNVKALSSFVHNRPKAYACGYQNEKGVIMLQKLVEDKNYWF